MEGVKQSIRDFRPELKDSSLSQYMSQLKKIRKLFGEEDFEFLEHPDPVTEMITTQGGHYTSQKNLYSAIVMYLKALNHDGEFDEPIHIYETFRNELRDQYQAEQETGVITDKQAKNFITMQELQTFIQKMKKDIKDKPQLHMVYVMFSILSRHPLRNDLAGMVYLTQTAYSKLTDAQKVERNYLVKTEGGFLLLDGDHKTAKTHGTIKIAIDKDTELAKVLRTYLRVMKYKTGMDIFPITPNYMSQLLIKTSDKYISKNISSTMIRKIVSSHKFLDAKEDQIAHAKELGHTVGTENLIYIKKAQ
tara:strand:+ start:573 stop:1487 length:915 start_codon:yes stop_codon:yes gene_type:complete